MIKNLYICDLCGKQVDKYTQIASMVVGRINDVDTKDVFDLCKNCRDNIMTIINGMKKK